MRIAFNATALLSPLTGIGQYAFELAQRLRADASLAPYFFYANGWSREVRSAPLPAARVVLPLIRRFLPNSYAISRHVQGEYFKHGVRQHKPDVYHEPNFLPFEFEGPTVTTVHDLSWIRHPEAHPKERVKAMNRYFEPCLRRSDLVLTDSEFVRQEVIEMFRVAPDRIRAIGLGASAVFRPMQAMQTQPLMQRLGLTHGCYLLAVGTLEPRKNLASAIRAYAGLPLAMQERVPLVLAGMKGWHTDALEREMAPLVQSGRLRVTGYLEREDLAALTAGATAMVYPSLYEGFGLPPLEAMACGVPAIVSRGGSLPEVVGDAGMQVESKDIDGLREAIRRMIEDVAMRQTFREKALVRATHFSWDRCAQETLAAYRDAIRLA